MPVEEVHTALGPGGEFDLIRRMLGAWGDRAHGLGDDGALLDVPPGSRLVVSTDMSLEGTHFQLDWLALEEIGYRAVAASLSDLAAMAATPLGVLIAMALPATLAPRVEALAIGVGEAAALGRCPIVGGDTTRGDRLCLAVTVLGHARTPVRRAGARPGDGLFVTGRLGAPGAALSALRGGGVLSPAVRSRFAHPVPRLDEARWLADAGITALIDLSDGLASDVRHLAAAGEVAMTVELDRLPVVEGVSALEAARSGEEYELLAAAPASLDVRAFEERFHLPVTRIGTVTATGSVPVTFLHRGVRVDPGMGHDHFSR
jgi:thiamine-monophosphate kinase